MVSGETAWLHPHCAAMPCLCRPASQSSCHIPTASPAAFVSQTHCQQPQALPPHIPHFLSLNTFINLFQFPLFLFFLIICFAVSSLEFSLLYPTISLLGPASLCSLKCQSLALSINQFLLWRATIWRVM